MEVSGGYWQTCALHAGVRLDLFTLLDNGPATAEKLAKEANADKRALEMLLNALCAMDLITKNRDNYANSGAGSQFLSRASDQYMGHIISHHHFLMPSWAHLKEAVRSGKPVRKGAVTATDEQREAFLMGMYDNARLLAHQVVEHVDLSGKKRLLDLGGGPGTYAIHFCRKNPNLTARVFDLPGTKPFAEKTIRQYGMEKRIEFVPGNFNEDPIQGRFDVVWASHIFHGESHEDCRNIVQKAAGRLTPGGTFYLHEFIMNDSMDGPLFPALFALNMLFGHKGRAGLFRIHAPGNDVPGRHFRNQAAEFPSAGRFRDPGRNIGAGFINVRENQPNQQNRRSIRLRKINGRPFICAPGIFTAAVALV